MGFFSKHTNYLKNKTKFSSDAAPATVRFISHKSCLNELSTLVLSPVFHSSNSTEIVFLKVIKNLQDKPLSSSNSIFQPHLRQMQPLKEAHILTGY